MLHANVLDNDADPDGDRLFMVLMLGPTHGTFASDASGDFSYSPDFGFSGTDCFTYRVVDTGTDEATACIDVIPQGNSAPVFTSVPITTVIQGGLYAYSAFATDSDPGDQVRYSLDHGPVGMSVDETTGEVTWPVARHQVGTQIEVVLRATDLAGQFTTQAYEIEVTDVSDPPFFVSEAPVEAIAGTELVYAAIAIDLDPGDLVSCGIVSAPLGANIDTATCRFTWNATLDQLGEQLITISATDLTNLTTTQTFVLR
ncbi:MAG: cadherin-like domain-containing protein, partial [Deltaproteobacteria bacterium]|nr:cadherin-like domain-containing protein [Deltaproteobacteria bacterium]